MLEGEKGQKLRENFLCQPGGWFNEKCGTLMIIPEAGPNPRPRLADWVR